MNEENKNLSKDVKNKENYQIVKTKYDDDEILVEGVEKDEKTAFNGWKYIAMIGAGVVASIIILCTLSSCADKLENNVKKKMLEKAKQETEAEYNNESAESFTQEEEKVASNEEQNMIQNDTTYSIDYSNVGTFYSHIIENRNKYGTFAESFQTEDDVISFINFLYKFDEMYNNVDTTSNITSQADYDRIIQDYYSSCVKHDVKGQLNLLYKNSELAQKRFAESEELAYNLKNGKGKDYSIANQYYTWFGVNLCDGRTAITRDEYNAPLIDGLREQYEQYRYSGNMLNARKYQKNDSLPIPGISIYYADEVPEGVEVIENQNSFSCPDWGIDNVVSKYEENTETKLVKKEAGEDLFKQIDEAFVTVLNRGKVR